MRVLLALLAITLLMPVSAQHEHGAGPVQVTTDLNGLALVGHPAHFNIIAFGDDDEPDFHQDLPVRVYNNDRLVFQTDIVSGHDYDGIQAFDIAFMEAGTWRVEAMQDGEVVAHRNGTVAGSRGDAAIDLVVDARAGLGGNDILIDLAIQENGTQVDHVDAIVEVFDGDGRLVFRTHTHTHDERQRLRFVPDADGDYLVRATGYIAFPTENGPRFTTVATERTVDFTRTTGPWGAPATTPPPQALNAVVRGEAGDFQLVGTYDPWTQVGSDTIQRLTATVLDDGVPVQHVDFEAELVGPMGSVFSSDTLHEYDGSYELAIKQADLGLYELRVSASRGDWSDEIVMPYAVVPAGVGAKSGDQFFTLEADLTARTPGQVTIQGQDAAGNPFAHGEIDLDIRTDGLPLLLTKIHTHGDGAFRFLYASPVNGTVEFGMTPFPLEAGLITGYHGEATGDPVPSMLMVEPGEDPVLHEVAPEAQSPGLPVVFLLGLLALAARR